MTIVRGPISFEDLRTVNKLVLPTFKDACMERGLLRNDAEWDRCLQEAAYFQSGKQIRDLFALILSHCHQTNALLLWNNYKNVMTQDILYETQKQKRD